MQREKAEKLLGRVIVHKKYGNVVVEEIISYKEEKILGRLESTGEEKMFILSSNYFSGVDDITFKKKFQEKVVKQHTYKPRDTSKFRNHPLLRKIDAEEQKYKALYSNTIDEDDDDLENEDD